MNIDFSQLIMPAAGAVTAIGGAWLTVQKISKNIKKERQAEAFRIIKDAEEKDIILKEKLETKIEKLESELDNLRSNVEKDLGHVKETYTNEIKNLGEKIEEIRDQLNSQHAQLLTFLTKLIEKKH